MLTPAREKRELNEGPGLYIFSQRPFDTVTSRHCELSNSRVAEIHPVTLAEITDSYFHIVDFRMRYYFQENETRVLLTDETLGKCSPKCSEAFWIKASLYLYPAGYFRATVTFVISKSEL